jgi:hypothetical protein
MNKKKFILPICALLAAIAVEALPFSMSCHWTPEKDVVIHETYSYFNMTVFRNGVYGPFVTTMLSIAMVLIIIVLSARKEPNFKQHRNMVRYGVLTFIASLTPLILGSEWFSIYSVVISALLLAATVMLHRMSDDVLAAEEALNKEREKKAKQAKKERQQAASNAGRKK